MISLQIQICVVLPLNITYLQSYYFSSIQSVPSFPLTRAGKIGSEID